MKIIDKNGKLFGKLHVFDLIVGIVFLTVLVGALNKFSNNAIIKIAGGSEQVKVTFWVKTIGYPERSLACIQPGDQLAENKRYLEGNVLEITVFDSEEGMMDNQGEMVVGSNPLNKKGLIKVEALLDKKGMVLKLGNQEIREGQLLFLTTDTVSISGYIIDYQMNE